MEDRRAALASDAHLVSRREERKRERRIDSSGVVLDHPTEHLRDTCTSCVWKRILSLGSYGSRDWLDTRCAAQSLATARTMLRLQIIPFYTSKRSSTCDDSFFFFFPFLPFFLLSSPSGFFRLLYAIFFLDASNRRVNLIRASSEIRVHSARRQRFGQQIEIYHPLSEKESIIPSLFLFLSWENLQFLLLTLSFEISCNIVRDFWTKNAVLFSQTNDFILRFYLFQHSSIWFRYENLYASSLNESPLRQNLVI